MKSIYVIETMNLILYCLFIGGIIYHIRWLRTNKDLVNDVRNLTAYDIRFPMYYSLSESRSLEALPMKHAVLPSVLTGFIMTKYLLGIRNMCYPEGTIFRDSVYGFVLHEGLFLSVTVVIFWWYVMLLCYSSNKLLQIGSFAGYVRRYNNGIRFNRCDILRRHWSLFCVFLTGMWLVIHLFTLTYAYMTDEEYVSRHFLVENHYCYDEIHALNIEVVFKPEGFEVYYNLELNNGSIVRDWSSSPLYGASLSEKKEMLDFINKKGVEIHRQELSRDEVAFIIGHGGAEYLSAIFPECKKDYLELWMPDNKFATTSRNGKRLIVDRKTLQVKEDSSETMSVAVRLLSVAVITPGIYMFWIGLCYERDEDTDSLDAFCVHMPPLFGFVGSLFMGIAVYCAFGMQKKEEFLGYAILTAGFVLIGMFCAVLPLKGTYDIEVCGSSVRIIRIKRICRTYYFEDIRLCEIRREGIRVYIKGEEKKAFDIDRFMIGYWNFHQRLVKDGIPIIVLNN